MSHDTAGGVDMNTKELASTSSLHKATEQSALYFLENRRADDTTATLVHTWFTLPVEEHFWVQQHSSMRKQSNSRLSKTTPLQSKPDGAH